MPPASPRASVLSTAAERPEATSWSASIGAGFWRPWPHHVLERRLHYPEEAVSARELIAIAVACLACHATWTPRPLDLIKRVLLSAAFLSWAASQLSPHAAWAPIATDIAIALFVLDLALLLWGELHQRSQPR
jgi:hypothetical protein